MAASPASPIERKLRADAYVLGRMSALEREAAQSDIETDAQFRDEVLRAAQRLGFGGGEGRAAPRPETSWDEVARHLSALPHMSTGGLPARDGERSPTVPIEPARKSFMGALRETWQTALALFRRGR
ncbi:MAG: hypothetical protein DI629_01040 [Mesorhizobium amorphae]|nr:MAG: hypothetical protein DI629_01040 [Mesorhizobium amorphae]